MPSRLMSLLLLLTVSCAARATTYCVHDLDGLLRALATPTLDEPGPHQIRLQPGSYVVPSAPAFDVPRIASEDFYLTGGWNADCTARDMASAETTLDLGNGDHGNLYIVDGIAHSQSRRKHTTPFAAALSQDPPVTAAVPKPKASAIDLRSFDSNRSASAIFTVVNKNDAGTGSLRAAIAAANTTPAADTIEFNMPNQPGACLQKILLQSPLPDITSPLVIDGYTQPQAQPNTAEFSSNAKLCVAIGSLNATLPQALQVPNGVAESTRFTVKGIAFLGSSGGSTGTFSVALRLRGGSDHEVQGNAFGGVGPTNAGQLGTLGFGVQIRDTAQRAEIGGPDIAHRNSFGGMTGSAIVLNDATSGDHLIINNFIGLSADGSIGSPISLNGIFASNSANVRIFLNSISSVPNSAAILIQGGSATGYRILGNKLGCAAGGCDGQEQFRNGVGVQIADGSGGHQISSSDFGSAGARILNSIGPGVWIAPSAGSGTSIKLSQAGINGQDFLSLDVDLGALGRSVNDPLDLDGGPNNGQNWPVVSQSRPTGSGTRQVRITLASAPNTPYLLSLYRGGCRAIGEGVGSAAGTSDANGKLTAQFNYFPGDTQEKWLSAVATNTETGDSSEAGPCFFEDVILKNGFQD